MIRGHFYLDLSTKSDDSGPTDKVLAHSQRRSWRPQISLLSFLLLITIVALSVSHFVQTQKYSKLKTEHENLRKDLDVLDIKNPDVICVIGLSSQQDSNLDRWRVYLPPNKNYVLRCALENIPEEGFDVPGAASMKFHSGAFSTGIGELWMQVTEKGVTIRSPYNAWEVKRNTHQVPPDSPAVRAIQAVLPHVQTDGTTGEPFQLKRQRFAYFLAGEPPNRDLFRERTDGVMLWIEEVTVTGAPVTNSSSVSTSSAVKK